MHHVRTFINFLDIVVGTFWGMTLYEVIPLFTSGSSTIVFTQADNIMKFVLSFLGAVYLVFRIHNYYHMSRIDRDLKAIELIYKQEELSKRDLKFLKKFYEEFLKDK